MSDVVAMAVSAVNVLTPGWRHGRPYAGPARPDEVAEALVVGGGVSYGTPDGNDVAQLRAYTDRMYAAFGAVEAGDADTACEIVNELMSDTSAAPVLSRHGGEPWHLHFHAPDASWARSRAAAMATSLAVVLGNPMSDRLGVCSAPQCDRVFVDTSRNGTRRFCSTSCQNRVKAAAFRARQRGA